jgi:tetratricopeptide (TPR) repeat protein
MRRIYVFVFLACGVSSAIQGQQSAEQQLQQISALEQRGRFDDVPAAVSQLVQSNTLGQDLLGRANLMLWIANQQRGNFKLAQSEYEQTIHSLSNNQACLGDYAAALDNLARLYLDMGEAETALSMEKKILTVYLTLRDHAAIARSYATLADLELNQGHSRKGKEYLSRALQEAKLASNLDEDFLATISSTQAWIAQMDGDPGAAVSGYARAVSLWTKQHGERHMLTGWGYMLLGKSYAQGGEEDLALATMRKGLSILSQTTGSKNPKYLAAEIAYSQVLDKSGAHVEAAHLKDTAEKDLADFYRNECMRCRVSVRHFDSQD